MKSTYKKKIPDKDYFLKTFILVIQLPKKQKRQLVEWMELSCWVKLFNVILQDLKKISKESELIKVDFIHMIKNLSC